MNSPNDNSNDTQFNTGESQAHMGSLCSLGLCRHRDPNMRSRSGAHSEIGPVRKTNDDLVFAGNHCQLFMVLDGVGGHAGGSEASRIVLRHLRESIESMCSASSERIEHDLGAAVKRGLRSACDAMIEVADEHPAYDKMGTVFALAFVADESLFYTHVGDCRVYLLRDGEAAQLTTDETFVQLMVDIGAITPDDIPDHPMRNVILNGIGTKPPDHDPVVQSEKLRPNDRILLTTDGITDMLNPQALFDIVAERDDPKSAAQALVEAAYVKGGRDNASCVVVMMEEREARPPSGCHDELHNELAKLHGMLGELDEVDDSLEVELRTVAADIQTALSGDAGGEFDDLRSRLGETLLKFEVSHPNLTNVVSRISDLLSRIGI